MSTTHTPATKLVSMNMSGNLHMVASYVTQFGLSDFFVQAESSGFNSTVLFKLPIDWPTDNHGPLAATPRNSMSLKLINGPSITRHVYHSSCGRVRLALTIGQARSVSHEGDCTQEVVLLAAKPEVASQLAELDKEHVRAELLYTGHWTDDDLDSDADNLLRFLWLAANYIAESPDETIDTDGDF